MYDNTQTAQLGKTEQKIVLFTGKQIYCVECIHIYLGDTGLHGPIGEDGKSGMKGAKGDNGMWTHLCSTHKYEF